MLRGNSQFDTLEKMADSDDDDEDFVPSKVFLSYMKRKTNTIKNASRVNKGKLPPPKKRKSAASSPPSVTSSSSPLLSQLTRSDRKALKTLYVPKKEVIIVLDDFDDSTVASNVSLPTQEGEKCASTPPANCRTDESALQGSAGAGSNAPLLIRVTESKEINKSELLHEGRGSHSSGAQTESSPACNGVGTAPTIGGRSAEVSTRKKNGDGHCSTPEALGHSSRRLNDADKAAVSTDCSDRDCVCVSDDDSDPEFDALLLSVSDTAQLEHSSSPPLAGPPLIQATSASGIHSTTQGRSPSMTIAATHSPKQQSSPSSKQTSLLYYFQGRNTQRFIPNRSQSLLPTFPKRPRHPFSKSQAANPPVYTATTVQKRSSSLPRIQVQYEPDGNAPPAVRSSCPFYKRVHGTTFTVDAFSYGVITGCTAYFLSHFHSDHYRGLSSRFVGTIFCSKPTGNLVVQELKVSSRHVHTLTLNQAHDVQGVMVTLLEANHCPGAVMFLFQLPCGSNILHTGDFRAHTSMFDCSPLQTLPSLKTLYLDTTYCDPQYSFPQQEEVVSFIVNRVVAEKKMDKRLLVVCGTYTIGKEKIFLGIARALGCKAGIDRRKKAVLDCLEDKAVTALVTTDLSSTCLHVQPMAKLTAKSLQSYLSQYSQQYSALLAVKPTGWTFGGQRKDWQVPQQHGRITIYGVPYSEHSSVDELEMFVHQLKPQRIIPTVGVGSDSKRRVMNDLIAQWTAQRI